VVVQQARASGTPVPDAADLAGQGVEVTKSVIDPETGLAVPVIPVDENVTSQPVVQPITTDPGPKPGQ